MIEWQEFVVESFQMATIQRVGVHSSVFAVAALKSMPFSFQSCCWQRQVCNTALPLSWCLEMVLHRMKLFSKTSSGAAGCVLCCQNSLIAPQFAKL